jgi:DMSO reductase anchor subunit
MERKPNWAAQIFLVLHPASVGCLLGALLLDPGGETRAFVIACVTVALVFAVAGAGAPVSAIKKPFRSYRFLAGVGHSPLSRQAVLVGLFTLLLLIHWILLLADMYAQALAIVTALIGAAAVLAVALVYLLSAQPVWRHWSTPLALLGGLLALGISTSLVVALGWGDALLSDAAGAIAARIVVLVGVVVLLAAAWGRVTRAATSVARAGQERSSARGGGVQDGLASAMLVIVAGIAAAASFAWDWAIIVCFVCLLVGLFAYWRLFFVASAPLDWRAEVNWYVPEPAGGRK